MAWELDGNEKNQLTEVFNKVIDLVGEVQTQATQSVLVRAFENWVTKHMKGQKRGLVYEFLATSYDVHTTKLRQAQLKRKFEQMGNGPKEEEPEDE